MEVDLIIHGRFQVPWEPCERATHTSQSEFCLVVTYSKQQQPRMCGHHTQNLLVLMSPQLSFSFGPYFCAGMDLYKRYVGFSPASKGSVMPSQSKHWSGSCRVCLTCSAAPVVRYTDSTGVVVSTDVGCCSWPFYR